MGDFSPSSVSRPCSTARDRTGAPIGLLDETRLRRFRTALTGVVAGAIARELFPALTDSFDLKEIRGVARRLDNVRRFCREFDRRFEAAFHAVEEIAEAIDGAVRSDGNGLSGSGA